MTRHVLRLIWNRKRSNFLIMVEILCAFLVLEGVMVLAAHYANNYRQPLGFSIDRVWAIRMDAKSRSEDKAVRAAQMATVHQLFNAVRDMPEVEAICGRLHDAVFQRELGQRPQDERASDRLWHELGDGRLRRGLRSHAEERPLVQSGRRWRRTQAARGQRAVRARGVRRRQSARPRSCRSIAIPKKIVGAWSAARSPRSRCG